MDVFKVFEERPRIILKQIVIDTKRTQLEAFLGFLEMLERCRINFEIEYKKDFVILRLPEMRL